MKMTHRVTVIDAEGLVVELGYFPSREMAERFARPGEEVGVLATPVEYPDHEVRQGEVVGVW